MRFIRFINKTVFAGFLVSIVIVFLAIRPLNSPWHRLINGDGLGYYAYLPAIFIYHDHDLEFKWFNAVYKTHYSAGTFSNPEDNFLVQYQAKRINKYYPGLSFAWAPFFLCAHLAAKLFDYPADGFSLPYQLMIGLASLFYVILGLWFLRSLLRILFLNGNVANWVPVVLFYGSPLFNYTINYNSLSHVYSFSFLTAFVYFTLVFFKSADNRFGPFIAALFFLVIGVCVRPINIIALFLAPVFAPRNFFSQNFGLGKPTRAHAPVALALAGLLVYQFTFLYVQTGSFISNTYNGEHFHFARSKFLEALFSYHLGLFVYVPVMLAAMAGILFLEGSKKYILPLLFFGVIFIYASWWYWPIVKRAPVDYYVIPSILLGALLNGMAKRRGLVLMNVAIGLCVVYYQFKEMQIRRGVLDEFLTYREVYWRNFFRTDKANMYLVPPSSVISREEYTEDFENSQLFSGLTGERRFAGRTALKIGPENSVVIIGERPFPANFSKAGRKKMRLSMMLYFEEEMEPVHVFMQFFNREHKLIAEQVFYLKAEDMPPNRWEYMEFGYELTDPALLNAENVSKIEFTIWNTGKVTKLWVDEARFEFMLCDESFETTK